MSKTKFTQGPWVAEDRVTGGKPPEAGCGVIASETELSISNPSRGIIAWASRSVNRTNEEVVANARLIAKAPDMAVFIKKHADDGDAEAITIWREINAAP